MCARSDQLLIDDNDTNVERFRARGGRAILFPRPWNRNHELSGDPMSHLREELSEL
jgi:5'(3')-deoxyribonucleotidase